MTPHRDSSLPPRARRILHVDVDAFLASVEQSLHPELRGKPVVVGGSPDSRNLVMACSYEARKFGVRSGMLASEAARRCPQAIFRQGDSQAANRKREEIARILLRFTPRVEVASIDDFFVDLTGTARMHGAACDVAARAQRLIREESALPVSIGIGANRTLARLAGKLAKPGGIAEILPGHEQAFLRRLPVEYLPGVGRSIGMQLERFAIRTVGELALVSREVLFASFGPPGLVVHDRARGIDESPVEATHVAAEDGTLSVHIPRTIRRDSTFEPEEGRREQIEAMLAYLVERATWRLRDLGALAGSVEVRLLYVDTRPSGASRRDLTGPDRWFQKRRKLKGPSAGAAEIWEHARTLLRAIPRRRALVKRVGLTLLGLRRGSEWQLQLFSDPESDRALSGDSGSTGSRADRERRIDQALDQLRERHGFGRILRGATLPLLGQHPLERDGFRLRTPSLNQ